MVPQIVAIGGGDVESGETESIDRLLIELTGKSQPKLLFIPTASNDSEEYVEIIRTVYSRLGCDVEALLLWGRDAYAEIAAEKIAAADAIYVGGGNTKVLIARWRELGVDEALRTFVDAGKPVGGLSAGALCWFREANSDWPQFEGIEGVNTAPLDCLGFVDLVVCPHTKDEGFRLTEFRQMMAEREGAGVGIDDGCALHIRGGEYRVVASLPGSVAHLLFSQGGDVRESILTPHSNFRSLDDLRRGVI